MGRQTISVEVKIKNNHLEVNTLLAFLQLLIGPYLFKERLMTKFMIAYHGGRKPSSQEEGQAHMQKWQEWIQSLGDKVVNPGTPLPTSKLITASQVIDDTNTEAMMGFAIIQAETIEDAIEIAKSDPFLATDGTIRLSKMMEM